jgi:hypothetical protein
MAGLLILQNLPAAERAIVDRSLASSGADEVCIASATENGTVK